MIALLGVELLLVYGVGSMLAGALGEADDAKGPILLVGPLAVVAALIVMFRFGEMAAALTISTSPPATYRSPLARASRFVGWSPPVRGGTCR